MSATPQVPHLISNADLRAGMKTWVPAGTRSFKIDETLRQQVPSFGCNGIHFLAGAAEGRKLVCYYRCGSSYVTGM